MRRRWLDWRGFVISVIIFAAMALVVGAVGRVTSFHVGWVVSVIISVGSVMSVIILFKLKDDL